MQLPYLIETGTCDLNSGIKEGNRNVLEESLDSGLSKDFWAVITNMFKELEETILKEVKDDNRQCVTTQRKPIKINYRKKMEIVDLKYIIIEMKYSLYGFNIRFELANEKKSANLKRG